MKTLDSFQKDFLVRLLEWHMEGLSGSWSNENGWDSPEVEDEYEETKSIRDFLLEEDE